MKILREAECPSLSGLSTLTYRIGSNEEKEIFIQLSGNTGAGIFYKGWIGLKEIESVFDSSKEAISSGSLKELLKGKSANTAGFLMAVLVSEGLIAVAKDNSKYFEKLDFKKNLLGSEQKAPAKKSAQNRKKVS